MEMKFKIIFSRLIDWLLPVHLRDGGLKALLIASFAILKAEIWALFNKGRKEDYFDLNYNGQVCYLRAALNAKFKSALGAYFEIGDPLSVADIVFAVTEKERVGHIFATGEPVPDNGVYALTETAPDQLNHFVIYVPADLYSTQLAAIKRFVEKYKLVTRLPHYKSK